MHIACFDVVTRFGNGRRGLHHGAYHISRALVGALHHAAQSRAVAVGAVQHGIVQAADTVLAQHALRIHHLRLHGGGHLPHKLADKAAIGRGIQFTVVARHKGAEIRQAVCIYPRLLQGAHTQAAALVGSHGGFGDAHILIQSAHKHGFIHRRHFGGIQAELLGIVYQVLLVALAAALRIGLRNAHHAPVAADNGFSVFGQSGRAGVGLHTVAQQFGLQVLRNAVYLHLAGRAVAVSVLVGGIGHGGLQIVRLQHLQVRLAHLFTQIYLGLLPRFACRILHLFGGFALHPCAALHLFGGFGLCAVVFGGVLGLQVVVHKAV